MQCGGMIHEDTAECAVNVQRVRRMRARVESSPNARTDWVDLDLKLKSVAGKPLQTNIPMRQDAIMIQEE